MKKLFLYLLVAIGSMLSMHAQAQLFFGVAQNSGNGPGFIKSTNISISTAQTTVPGQPATTAIVSPPGGSFTDPPSLFTYGIYWVTPSLFTPLNISINSGYTATIQNGFSTPVKVHLQISFWDYNIGNWQYAAQSSTISIGAYPATAVTAIPAASHTYITDFRTNPPYGMAVPVLLTVVQDF